MTCQDETIENTRVLTDCTHDYGVYSGGSAPLLNVNAQNIPDPATTFGPDYGMTDHMNSNVKPDLCIPWKEKAKEIPSISGDTRLAQQI